MMNWIVHIRVWKLLCNVNRFRYFHHVASSMWFSINFFWKIQKELQMVFHVHWRESFWALFQILPTFNFCCPIFNHHITDSIKRQTCRCQKKNCAKSNTILISMLYRINKIHEIEIRYWPNENDNIDLDRLRTSTHKSCHPFCCLFR